MSELKSYALQDSKCLYDALMKAQEIYFDKYNVDISLSLSTASLSKKIFRTHFLDKPVPTLNGFSDYFVRQGYYGGATDCYIKYGVKLYYYDVNSLYPFVMLKDMPTKIVKKHSSGDTIDIINFFGFINCIVHAPRGIANPIVPFKNNTKVIYPTGTFKGVYFSEMIKEAMRYGYTFEFISGLEFEKEKIFTKYIEHFYNIKAEAKKLGDTALTFIAKMHLNQLYGIFGMKQNGISTMIAKNEDLPALTLVLKISQIMEVNEEYSVVVYNKDNSKESERPSQEFVEEILIEDATPSNYSVKSNVAIAAAVTSYAQIEMMKYKNNINFNIYYSDTYSIFIDKPLPSDMVGNGLGQMKNETFDKFGVECISEAYFLGIKKYGYNVLVGETKHDCSVFAGVKRDSIPFETIEMISSGKAHTVSQPSRMLHPSNSFAIIQKDDSTSTITNEFHKELVGNFYKPIHVEIDS